MDRIILQQKTTNSILVKLSNILFDPKLYFTVAIFAGEASPSFMPISSGWMYLFGLVGLLLLVTQKRIIVRKKISIVLFMYLVVLIRNISFKESLIFPYQLPLLGTALILLIFNCVFYKEEDINQIEIYVFIFANLMAMLGLMKFFLQPSGRLAVFGGPNGYYKITLLFEVLCYYKYMTKKKNAFLFGAVVGLLLCFATGSKGGVVCMVAVLVLEIVFFVFSSQKKAILAKRLLQLLLAGVAGYFLFVTVIVKIPGISGLLSRATSFLTEKVENVKNFSSVSARVELIELGWQFFLESSIVGKGARYTFFYTNGAQPYSHNIFIEFLSEQGLIGTIPLVIFFLGIIYRMFKYAFKDVHLFCLCLCLIVYFSGSLFSGDILDSKTIFMFGVLIYNYTINLKKNRLSITKPE